MRELFVHFHKKLSARHLARPIALCLMPYAMLRRGRAIAAERTRAVTVRSAAWSTARRTITAGSIAARADTQLRTLRTTAITATIATHTLIFTRSFTWWAFGPHDLNVVIFIMPRLRNCFGKLCYSGSSDTHMGFVRRNPDGANIILGHTAAAAKQGQYPFGIGIVPAADIKLEPDRIVESSAMVVTDAFAAAVVEHVFCLRHFGTVDAHKCGRNIFSRHRLQQLCTQGAVFVFDFNGRQKCFKKALMVLGTDICCGRDLNPVSLNLRTAQHRLNALAALIGNDENCGALATGTASTA